MFRMFIPDPDFFPPGSKSRGVKKSTGSQIRNIDNKPTKFAGIHSVQYRLTIVLLNFAI